uniref:Uncharacterized protein n=1 Tax=Timema poppense TaxID=170557 RepID=A0A7R9D848_TIMPO|nr:unnamed protein product [Timema poppensis]
MKKLIQASGLDDEKGLDPNQITSTSASSTPSNSSKIRSGRSSNRECLSDIVGQDVGEASLSWLGSDNTEHRGTIPKQILPLTRCEEGPIENLSHKDLNERLPNTSSASSITQSSRGDSGTKAISTACRINETYSLRLQTPVSLPKNLRSLQGPANIDTSNISGKEISLARMRRRNMVKKNNDTLTRKNATLHGETNAQEESVKIFKEANDIRNKEKSSNARSDETSEFSSSKGQVESVSYKDGECTHKLCNLRSYKLPPLTVYNHRSLDSAETTEQSSKTTEQSSKELPLKEYNTLPLKLNDQRSDTKVGQMIDQTNGIGLSNRHSLTNKKGMQSHTYFKSDTFMAADKLCDEFYAIRQFSVRHTKSADLPNKKFNRPHSENTRTKEQGYFTKDYQNIKQIMERKLSTRNSEYSDKKTGPTEDDNIEIVNTKLNNIFTTENQQDFSSNNVIEQNIYMSDNPDNSFFDVFLAKNHPQETIESLPKDQLPDNININSTEKLRDNYTYIPDSEFFNVFLVQNATEIENGSVKEVGDNANDCSHSPIRKDESSFKYYETYLHRKELNAQFPDKKHSLEDLEGAGEGCCQKARWKENPPPDEEECPSLNSVLMSDVSDEFISCHGRICKLIMNFFFAPKKDIAFQEYPQFS